MSDKKKLEEMMIDDSLLEEVAGGMDIHSKSGTNYPAGNYSVYCDDCKAYLAKLVNETTASSIKTSHSSTHKNVTITKS